MLLSRGSKFMMKMYSDIDDYWDIGNVRYQDLISAQKSPSHFVFQFFFSSDQILATSAYCRTKSFVHHHNMMVGSWEYYFENATCDRATLFCSHATLT